MLYRRLGRAGLTVSVLSFGSYVSFDNQLDGAAARDSLAAAYDAGVNFFDNADGYANGASERLMGQAIAELGWPRESFVLATKLFFGTAYGPNAGRTLNRKYLMHGIDASLDRLGLEFVDVLFCHRADPETPLEETMWALQSIIESGKALYWGTSEWPVDTLRAAYEIADRDRLHRPVTEQTEYNILNRQKVERDYAPLCDEMGLGLTTWGPLAAGLLTGKYLDGVPAGSRATLEGADPLSTFGAQRLATQVADADLEIVVRGIVAIAGRLGCTPAQLALAWCARNPRVSSVITGASRPEQIRQNMDALDVIESLTDDVVAEIAQLTSQRTPA